jgi:hypothetical protein
MLSTLIVVIILGVIVTIAIANRPTPNATSASGTVANTATTTATAKTIGSDAQASAVAACQANFVTISTAISTYRALNGSPPPAGTAWVTSASHGNEILQSWPITAGARLVWDGTTLSVFPTRGAPSHESWGTPSPESGCFAA